MREYCKEYERIGEKLIKFLDEFEYIRESCVRIAFLASDEEKKKDGKWVFADCMKVAKQYEWCVPYEFFITVYEPNCIGLSQKQMEILMRHELHHIGINNEGNEPVYYIVPHDVEDFRCIIDSHGLDWSRREVENDAKGRKPK